MGHGISDVLVDADSAAAYTRSYVWSRYGGPYIGA